MKILKNIIFSASFIVLGAFTVAAQANDFPLGNWEGNYHINSGICKNKEGSGVISGTATLIVTGVRNHPTSSNTIEFSGYLKLWGGNAQGVPAGFEYYSPKDGKTGQLEGYESGTDFGSSYWFTVLTPPSSVSIRNWSGRSSPHRISVSHTEGNCKMEVSVYPPASRKK